MARASRHSPSRMEVLQSQQTLGDTRACPHCRTPSRGSAVVNYSSDRGCRDGATQFPVRAADRAALRIFRATFGHPRLSTETVPPTFRFDPNGVAMGSPPISRVLPRLSFEAPSRSRRRIVELVELTTARCPVTRRVQRATFFSKQS